MANTLNKIKLSIDNFLHSEMKTISFLYSSTIMVFLSDLFIRKIVIVNIAEYNPWVRGFLFIIFVSIGMYILTKVIWFILGEIIKTNKKYTSEIAIFFYFVLLYFIQKTYFG